MIDERPQRLAPLAPEEWSAEQAEILVPVSAGKGLGRGVINVFATLMESAKSCTLGQMSHALYRAGGQYRRNM